MSDTKMIGRPLKFRIIEILSDGIEMWNYEIVKQLMKEYNLKSNFARDNANFDLIEVSASGFITATESEIDTEGKLRVGALLNKYKITDLGKAQYEDLLKNIR
ncbi:MAG: hypothetical protein RBR05_05410 [Candidatus Methanomethylophilaceae archaeon]|nr:hypothetical protein [Candidatus Methanomethylophilaceae archaeon]